MTATIDRRPVGFGHRGGRKDARTRPSEQVLVVVPTYCEGTGIVGKLARVRCAFPAADVLVVDDHSPDDTANYAARLGKHLGHITVIDQPSGPDAAWQIGASYGAVHGYDIVVELHAQHSVIQSQRRPALEQGKIELEDGADLSGTDEVGDD